MNDSQNGRWRCWSHKLEVSSPTSFSFATCFIFRRTFTARSKSTRGFSSERWLIRYRPAWIFEPFDLIISAAPHFVDRLRKAGREIGVVAPRFRTNNSRSSWVVKQRTSNLRLSVRSARTINSGSSLLEELCRKVPISFWGAGAESLPADSPLRGRVKPPLWGYDMYRQLQRSKIALNIHIDMAEQYAANMRLYEATGVGTMLLTDWKTNLPELFETGKEVAAYRSTEECVELVKYYLSS